NILLFKVEAPVRCPAGKELPGQPTYRTKLRLIIKPVLQCSGFTETNPALALEVLGVAGQGPGEFVRQPGIEMQANVIGGFVTTILIGIGCRSGWPLSCHVLCQVARRISVVSGPT